MPISTWGRDFLLVENGQATLPIVIAKDAQKTTVFAAEELKRYMAKIGGAEFEIKRGLVNEGIVLVNLSSTNEIFDCPEVPDLKPDGYCMLPRQEGLFLFGSNARSLLYAVYDLLERCGCCWPTPALALYEGHHEIIPKSENVEVSIRSVILEGPDMKYRKLYVEEGFSHNTENLLQMIDWMAKRRLNTLVIPLNYAGHGKVKWDNWREALTPELEKRGIWIEVGGHGYENYLNANMEDGTLFEKHPEWFALNDKGERERNPHWVFCSSNQEAFDYILNNVTEYLESHPEIDIFDFWPPDCAHWCECDNCRALGGPEELHARVVSKASRKAKQVRPDVQFECIVYASYVKPPSGVFLDPEILVDFCPISQCFDYQIYEVTSQTNVSYRNSLETWRKRFEGDISIYSYYRKYAWNSLPVLIPEYMQADLRYYRDIEVNGISSYAEPGDWGTYELNHYVLSELAWNCDVDVEAVVNRFAEMQFGTLASLAKKVYTELGTLARTCSSIPHHVPKEAEQYRKAGASIQQLRDEIVEGIASADNERIKRSLQRLLLSVEYLAKDAQLKYMETSGAEKSEMQTKAQQLWDFILEHKDEGVFLTGRLSLHVLASRYGLKMK